MLFQATFRMIKVGARVSVAPARLFHGSLPRSNSQGSSLSQLRKKTGYSFKNCRTALEMFTGDLVKAEEWLHAEAQKEGWAKATSLEHRQTKQGLLGVAVNSSRDRAAIVELNCETDFVGKNETFQELVKNLARNILTHVSANFQVHEEEVKKVNICGKDLMAIPSQDEPGKTLADVIAYNIGLIRENMILRRAVFMAVGGPVKLDGHAHPVVSTVQQEGSRVTLGKFSTIVAYRNKSTSNDMETLEYRVRELCLHAIGMNPSGLGTYDPPPEPAEKPVVETKENKVPEVSVAKDEEQPSDQETNERPDSDDEKDVSELQDFMEDNESRFLQQKFLLSPGETVRSVTLDWDIELVDYLRLQCGENVHSEEIQPEDTPQKLEQKNNS